MAAPHNGHMGPPGECPPALCSLLAASPTHAVNYYYKYQKTLASPGQVDTPNGLALTAAGDAL